MPTVDATEWGGMIEYYISRGYRLTPLQRGIKKPVLQLGPRIILTTKKQTDQYPGGSFGWLLDADHLVVGVDLTNTGYEGMGILLDRYKKDTGHKISEDYPIVMTPSGGLHIYMSKPYGTKTYTQMSEKYPGVDFLSRGAYVAIVDGGAYQFMRKSPWSRGPKKAPQWLLDDILRSPKGVLT